MASTTLVLNCSAARRCLARVFVLPLTMLCFSYEPALAQQGYFELFVHGSDDPGQQFVATHLGDGHLQGHMVDINDMIYIARPVPITFAPWSDILAEYPDTPEGFKANAFYDSVIHKAIFIPYEFVGEIMSVVGDAPEEWFPMVEQTVFHEMSHALIDVNRIQRPPGSRETLADQLGFFIVSEVYDDPGAAIQVARHYLVRDRSDDALAQKSEHLPDYDRAIEFACWTVGRTLSWEQQPVQDPGRTVLTWDQLEEEFGDFTSELAASGCESKYDKLIDTWRALLPWRQ